MALDAEDHRLLDDVVRAVTKATDRMETLQETIKRLATSVIVLTGKMETLQTRIERLEHGVTDDNPEEDAF